MDFSAWQWQVQNPMGRARSGIRATVGSLGRSVDPAVTSPVAACRARWVAPVGPSPVVVCLGRSVAPAVL